MVRTVSGRTRRWPDAHPRTGTGLATLPRRPLREPLGSPLGAEPGKTIRRAWVASCSDSLLACSYANMGWQQKSEVTWFTTPNSAK